MKGSVKYEEENVSCGAYVLIVMMTQISAFASSYATYAVHNEKAVLKAADNLGEYAVIPKNLKV